MTGRLLRVLTVSMAVGLFAVLAACGSGAGGAVTVTQQVGAPPATDRAVTVSSADAGSGVGPGATASTPSNPSSNPPSTSNTGSNAPTPTSTSAAGSASADSISGGSKSSAIQSSATKSGATKSGATKSGSDVDPGYVIPTRNDPDVGRDVPGPDGGTKCATDAKYYDEAPTGMRPDVIAAWHHFEKVANAQGIIVCLNDGKRSSAQQQAQYDEYVQEYGKEVADQLVLTPEKSSHVTGNALDVQPQAAYQFLQSTDGSLGLCRIYDNESWHFEYDVKYFTDGCPPRLPRPQH